VKNCVFTVGHSTHALEHFLSLLKKNEISAIADVRSQPYSRFNTQFNRETLESFLRLNKVSYVFLGDELGARSKDRSCYIGDQVQYDRLAKTDLFKEALQRVIRGADTHRIALMCSEKDPITCHRTILVGRQLIDLGIELRHILSDGNIETHQDAMNRLFEQLKLPQQDLFRSHEEISTEAYSRQASRIAYVDDHKSEKPKSRTGSRW
jgi:uncharacterized protein (DUF488 family)